MTDLAASILTCDWSIAVLNDNYID